MTGYFTRLQHQTGIAFGPDSETADPMPESLAAEPPQDLDAAPIEIEEHRIVEAQSSEPRLPTTRTSTDGSESSAEVDPVPSESVAPKPTHQATQPPWTAASQQQSPATPALNLHAGEAGYEAGESPAAEPHVLPNRRTEATTARSKTATAGTPPTGSGGQGATSPVRQTPAPTVRKETRIVREQVWRTAYQQVADWVTTQPTSTTREQQEQIAGKVVEQLQERVPGVIQTESFQTGEESRKRPSHTNTEIRDLHLTIGKLEVTLDQSAQRGQPPQRQETRSSKPVATSVSRRLRRHYITP